MAAGGNVGSAVAAMHVQIGLAGHVVVSEEAGVAGLIFQRHPLTSISCAGRRGFAGLHPRELLMEESLDALLAFRVRLVYTLPDTYVHAYIISVSCSYGMQLVRMAMVLHSVSNPHHLLLLLKGNIMLASHVAGQGVHDGRYLKRTADPIFVDDAGHLRRQRLDTIQLKRSSAQAGGLCRQAGDLSLDWQAGRHLLDGHASPHLALDQAPLHSVLPFAQGPQRGDSRFLENDQGRCYIRLVILR